jgi:hypothetical protein
MLESSYEQEDQRAAIYSGTRYDLVGIAVPTFVKIYSRTTSR